MNRRRSLILVIALLLGLGAGLEVAHHALHHHDADHDELAPAHACAVCVIQQAAAADLPPVGAPLHQPVRVAAAPATVTPAVPAVCFLAARSRAPPARS